MGLLDPSSVPFGMDKAFLSTDPNKEQHFLRAEGHPFGRYDNCVPFFQGIPPYIVHFFFIQTLLSTETALDEVKVERPEERITLQVLVLLHQALTQRSSTLPLTLSTSPANTKQRFAKTYRDGQARIIHAVRLELQSAIDALLVPQHSTTLPHRSSSLLPLPTALAALHAEYPSAATHFTQGMQKHNLSHSPHDSRLTWTLLLITYASLILTNASNASGLNAELLERLGAAHPLPHLEDGIEDGETYSFLDEHVADFLALDAGLDPCQVLDELGLSFVEQGGAFVDGPTENLGVRLMMWGMGVVQDGVLAVAGVGEGGVEMCLFVGSRDGMGEWMD
ncbi:hypothetical protein M3J09_001673 [Ascochyta lentis]